MKTIFVILICIQFIQYNISETVHTIETVDTTEIALKVGDVLDPDPLEYAANDTDNLTLSLNDEPFRDLRLHNDQDFHNAVMGDNSVYTVGTQISLGSDRASQLHKDMTLEMVSKNTNEVVRFIVHTIDTTGDDSLLSDHNTNDWNDQLIEEWVLSVNEDQSLSFSVKIHTKNVNDPTNPVSTEEMSFNCKLYGHLEDHVCVPSQCEFKPTPLASTPAKKCVKHYEKSATYARTVYLATEKEKEPTGSDTYRWIVDCFAKKIEDLEFKGSEVCFYEGFEPTNMVSLETLEKELNGKGFYYSSESKTFVKSTITEHHRVEVDVNATTQEITNVLNQTIDDGAA